MALTISVTRDIPIGDTAHLYEGTLSWDDSYPTGGESFNVTGNEKFSTVIFGHKGGYTFEWDEANQKVIAYYVDNDAGADSAQIQVPNTTDLAAVTGVKFLAIGA